MGARRMHHYGTAPEGLPESTRNLIVALAPRLGPEDTVRMLKLLGDAQGGDPPQRQSADRARDAAAALGVDGSRG